MNDYPQPWRKAEDGEYKTCKPIGEVCEICDHHGWPLMKCNNEQIRDGVLALAAENERLRALVKQQRKVIERVSKVVQRSKRKVASGKQPRYILCQPALLDDARKLLASALGDQ
jgi:hypothetical protein